jgi:SRSO17 transposase
METSISQVFASVNSMLPEKNQLYITGLLMTDGKKNCSRMARGMGISKDKINRSLNSDSLTKISQEILLKYINTLATFEDQGHLIGDDTVLKRFGPHIEGVDKMYSSLEEKIVLGQCPVVLAWSNGEVTIPIAWAMWIPRDQVDAGKYRTKQEIIRDLIQEVQSKLTYKVKKIFLDGLYHSQEMMEYLDNNDLNFVMRLPKNRKLQLMEKGESKKAKDHIKLTKNTRKKQWIVFMNGKARYVAAQKEKNKAGDYVTTYVIANFELSTPQEYLSLYLLRWSIEQLFRTSKQLLGLGDCQAMSLLKHREHISLVFLLYGMSDMIKYIKKLDCTEDGVRYLKVFILGESKNLMGPADQVFHAYAQVLIDVFHANYLKGIPK